ncbi:MAG: TIGR01212 family radical SAM protein [Lachnospiraceae bacterium]|nr:TIGR01212 family radical SAM protein [Lachnospiraceae bacterium]
MTTLNQYLRTRFGCKVYKLSLNGGFTCPNRDGTKGDRGCIFCSEGGSGDFAESENDSITAQIEKAKDRVKNKIKDGKYIAYFQAYTGTYGPVEKLEKMYMEAANHPDIVAVSIATRPDCLPEEVLDLLEKVNKIKPVWIELGLQTIHERSADYIRRGYDLKTYDDAVANLKKRGIEVIVHVILGLPRETVEDMVKTVDYVCKSGADGIKLQLLHVLKNTDMAKDYEAGKFETLTEDEYMDILKACLSVIPEDVVVHRLTGDGDKKILIAPMWSANKRHVMNRITRELF